MKFFSKTNNKKEQIEDIKNKYMEKKAKEKGDIELELSLRPNEEIKTSKVVRDVYKEEISEFAEINEGDLNVSTSYIFRAEDGYEASIYIRNATKFNINLENPCLIVTNEDGKILLQKIFNGEELGTIPAFSVRPWKIYFDNTYVPEAIDLKNYKVNFKAQKPFAENGEVSVGFKALDGLTDDKAIEVIDYNYRLPLLKENEVNFNMSSLEIVNGFLDFNLIIRNSTENTLVNPDTLKPLVEELPVAVYKDDEKVFSEVLRVGAIVGAKQAKYVHLSTSYKADNTEGLRIKLNEL